MLFLPKIPQLKQLKTGLPEQPLLSSALRSASSIQLRVASGCCGQKGCTSSSSSTSGTLCSFGSSSSSLYSTMDTKGEIATEEWLEWPVEVVALSSFPLVVFSFFWLVPRVPNGFHPFFAFPPASFGKRVGGPTQRQPAKANPLCVADVAEKLLGSRSTADCSILFFYW